MDSSKNWQRIAAEKRASAFERIPKSWRLPHSLLEKLNSTTQDNVLKIPHDCGILSKQELEITEQYDATALAEKLARGKFTAVAVTTAFSKRAAIAQQLTNCLTETFFDEALERAKFLDEHMEREKKPIGPFHGVPISIKDSFRYKGQAATIGYVSWVEKPVSTEHSPLVRILLELGAVLYVKTNIPQTLMTADSDNNVFGRTLNPNKLTLTAGGSSGGEGALIAMRGSILGVGTDIAGSIRIPALCCGIYGFKPSTNRIPYSGQAEPVREGMPGLAPSAGPLCTSARDMTFFMESVIAKAPWNLDCKALCMPWRAPAVESKKKLRIGVLAPDSSFPLTPPVARAMAAATKNLSESTHEMVELKNIPSIKDATDLCAEFFYLDNTNVSFQHVHASGEPVIPSIGSFHFVHKDSYTLDDLFEMNSKREAVEEDWRKVFVQHDLDVIVAPSAETVAVPHDTYGIPPYTMLWNLLDYPAAVIPFLKADETIDENELWPKGALREYSAEAVHGAPISIQIIARTGHDEELLSAVSIIVSKVLTAHPHDVNSSLAKSGLTPTGV